MDHPAPSLPRVAVIGSGISGLSAAWHLRHEAAVTLFEADTRAGGHANTVDITLDGQRFGVDTGFLVCNHRTYPGLMRLLRELQVELTPAQMGFSVQVRPPEGPATLEWAGTGLRGLFADRRQLLRLAFWGMLRDIPRFNRLATAVALAGPGGTDERESTGNFLRRHGFGAALREHYLVPMAACIWSCSTRQMMDFPIATLARFCHNHGLLQVLGQPPWYSLRGGSRRYVQRVCDTVAELRLGCPVQQLRPERQGVSVLSARGMEHFDAVVLASHSDQALRLLGEQASALQRELLGAIRYQPNRAVLHTDTALMPERRAAWAAWNYENRQPAPEDSAAEAAAPRVCLHYWLNALQELPTRRPVLVSLNPLREPAAEQVLAEFEYAHPVFDAAAIEAQRRLPQLDAESATTGLWFAGAWRRYGFHEDGYQAGLCAAEGLRRWLSQGRPLQEAA